MTTCATEGLFRNMLTPAQSLPGTTAPLGNTGSVIPGRARGQVRDEISTTLELGLHRGNRCSHWRQGCPGTMAFFITTMGYTVERLHTCRNVDDTDANLADVTNVMKDRVDTLAIG
ncbi:hypothetical protein PHMEG_00039722 [Phytophthora megakarya]|uniref:Uncharacterized protein n=1 Tax=Phytophthora megakarya TaxID=4795 RepID=A0A225UHN7_9STRA|nr:hypothetical protein PHMEG_00039722 [Phytophthora megakarya]